MSHPLDAVVRENGRVYKNLAMRLLHNHEDAEDAVQEAYLLAFRKFAQFQGKSKLSSWVGSIVINTARMQRRRDKHKGAIFSLDAPPIGADSPLAEIVSNGEVLADEAILNREQGAVVVRMIASLSTVRQEVIRLRFQEEMQTKHIAARLGVTASAVKARTCQALKNLREQAKRDR